MRKQLFAIASSVALGVAMSTPASAIQLSPDTGFAQDTNVIHVRDRADSGGRSGNIGNFGGRSGSSGPGMSARGNFEPRGQVQTRDFSRSNIQLRGTEPRGQVQSRDF